jgi:hypothetical protein
MSAPTFYDYLPKALTVDLNIQMQSLELTQKFSTPKRIVIPIKYENPLKKHQTAA